MTEEEKRKGREKLGELYPDLLKFIEELEKVFGETTGTVRKKP
jgi:hypothetical protein